MNEPVRCGTVALVGRPNAGKSSLLNALVGARIAAVSRRPQTTRTRLAGVYTAPGLQAVLVDTPGLHSAWTPLNQFMVREAEAALEEVDLACWIVDAIPVVASLQHQAPPLDDELEAVKARLAGRPVIVALNKVDAVEKLWLLPVIAAFADVGDVVPISARQSDGLDALCAAWKARLPAQPAMYPEDHVTDAMERQICAELIRERVFENTSEEVPYASAVEIERFDESKRAEGLVHVHARIVCEKQSQKGILVGKAGSMVKRIGTEARVAMEELLGCRVRLDLFIAVEPDWTKKPRMLKGLGYAG